MKKILSKLLLFLSMALILSGCTKAVQKAEKEVVFSKPQYNWGEVSGKTITVWGGEDDLKRSYLKKAFARYQEITGNTLKIRTLSNDEFAEDVPKAFASPDAEKPDILLSYGGTNLDNLKPDDNFYDFTKAQWVEDLTDSAINQTIYNGKVIGLPHGDVSISGTLYNKEIFKKYGLEVPENQEAFMAVCEELLKNGVTPVYLPYEGATMLLYQFPMDSFLQDAETLERLNNGTLSYSQIPEMKKIIQWYRTMASKGYFGKNYTDNNWDGMSGALESGKYAMMLCWDTWLYTDFKGDPSQFGLMPAFIGVPEEGTFEGPNQMLLIANKNSPQLDAAINMITFMADPYNYNVAYEEVYTAPIFKNQVGSTSTPQYVEFERLIDKHYYDSTAWLRIKGFSQLDAVHIQKYMQDYNYKLDDCMKDMENSRRERAGLKLTEK